MASCPLPYDPSSAESILRYAERLVGHTLREMTGVSAIDAPTARRGSFGSAVESLYFGIDPNNDQAPDFKEAGIELKTTPLKRTRTGQLVAKERLVLSMIGYEAVAEETWETSAVLKKCGSILLVSYLYEPEKDPVDYEFRLVRLWSIPEEDLPVIRRDWQTVVDKVRAGRAHEISGGDTFYLEACTKAANSEVRTSQPFSDIPAKPRAWALKQSYMTAVSQRLLDAQAIERGEGQRDLSLVELVRQRFEPYLGKTEQELAESFGLLAAGKRTPKGLGDLITKRILGVDPQSRIAEFEKAGIKTKTMRLARSGRPKEAISFPAFDYFELARTPFEQSAFLGQLEQKYLFVVYREEEGPARAPRLEGVMLWQMPEEDLPEARRCYEEMRRRVLSGQADRPVRSTENRCCHVRPHARNKRDTLPTPQGAPMVKRSFWLNQDYIKEQVEPLLAP